MVSYKSFSCVTYFKNWNLTLFSSHLWNLSVFQQVWKISFLILCMWTHFLCQLNIDLLEYNFETSPLPLLRSLPSSLVFTAITCSVFAFLNQWENCMILYANSLWFLIRCRFSMVILIVFVSSRRLFTIINLYCPFVLFWT